MEASAAFFEELSVIWCTDINGSLTIKNAFCCCCVCVLETYTDAYVTKNIKKGNSIMTFHGITNIRINKDNDQHWGVKLS